MDDLGVPLFSETSICEIFLGDTLPEMSLQVYPRGRLAVSFRKCYLNSAKQCHDQFLLLPLRFWNSMFFFPDFQKRPGELFGHLYTEVVLGRPTKFGSTHFSNLFKVVVPNEGLNKAFLKENDRFLDLPRGAEWMMFGVPIHHFFGFFGRCWLINPLLRLYFLMEFFLRVGGVFHWRLNFRVWPEVWPGTLRKGSLASKTTTAKKRGVEACG